MRFGRKLGWVAGTVTVLAMMLPAPAHADDAGDQQWFIDRINEQRMARGVAPLIVDDRLTEIARRWAVHMADVDTLSHNTNVGKEAPPEWALMAENVGLAGHDLEVLEYAFEHSPHHFDNMVDARFSRIGVGVVIRNERMWVAEEFMAVRALPPPAPAPAAAPAAVKAAPKPVAKKAPARRR